MKRLNHSTAPPVILPFEPSINTKTSTKVLILCTISQGAPPFRIEWMKDDKVIQSDDHTRIKQDDEYSTLSIKSTRESDAGNYTCQAKNSYGSHSFTTRLTIQGKESKVNWSRLKPQLFPSKSTTDMDKQAERRASSGGIADRIHLFSVGPTRTKHKVEESPRYQRTFNKPDRQ